MANAGENSNGYGNFDQLFEIPLEMNENNQSEILRKFKQHGSFQGCENARPGR
jgi:hypothetical protein